MRNLFTLVFLAVLLAGCVDTHQLLRREGAGITLSPADAVLIAVPEDGSYGTDAYPGSGKTTAQTIYAAFAKRTHVATTARSTQSFDEALQSARDNAQKYLVFPTILHWEDRATEWSGKRDKIEVKIEVVDAPSGKIVQSVVVTGRSKWATFGGDHPQDSLPEPIEEFVLSLY